MESIWAIASPYLPVVASFLVTHLLAGWKKKVNKENPFLWWVVSFVGNLIIAGGGSVAMGADEASAGLNTLLSQAVSQGYHSYLKKRVKDKEATAPTPTV